MSVVIAVSEAPATLEETFEALERQDAFGRAEVIVSDGSPDGLESRYRQRYPWLRFLRPSRRTLPFLKGEAIQAARADIVAILDPVDVPEPGWIHDILDGLAGVAGPSAVGGVVLPSGPATAANRAAYLFEYGAFNPPVHEGVTDADLPGNNVAYVRRVLVETCADVLVEEGFNKPFCHERIRERGGHLVIRAGMRVRHLTRHGFRAFAVRRFHYGRCFGATRWRRSPLARKFLYALFAPAVPALLVVRYVARAVRTPQNRRLLPRASLALVGFCLSWGVGEWLGYWFGPGRSCERFV